VRSLHSPFDSSVFLLIRLRIKIPHAPIPTERSGGRASVITKPVFGGLACIVGVKNRPTTRKRHIAPATCILSILAAYKTTNNTIEIAGTIEIEVESVMSTVGRSYRETKKVSGTFSASVAPYSCVRFPHKEMRISIEKIIAAVKAKCLVDVKSWTRACPPSAICFPETIAGISASSTNRKL